MSSNNTTSPPPSDCHSGPVYLIWTLRLAYSVIFVLGSFGNAVVCLAIVKRKQLSSSIGMFTFNLAFHDLVLVIVYVPTQMIALENCFTWILGDFMCHLVYLILPLSLSVSIGTLLAITGDRFRVIVFPVKSKLTKTTVKLIIAAIWIVSAVTALPLVSVIKIVPLPNMEHCAEDWPRDVYSSVYWVSMFVFQYLLPLAIIAVLAAITAHSLRKNSMPAAMESCQKSEQFRKTLEKRVKQTQKIIKMLIALVMLYAICMLPQHVVYTFWTRYGNLSKTSFREQANIVANMFPIANSALNAIAYGTLNKEFKAVFTGLFSCVCFKRGDGSSVFRRNMENTATKLETSFRKVARGQPSIQRWTRREGGSPDVRINLSDSKSTEPDKQAQNWLARESTDSIECSRYDDMLQLISQKHDRLNKNGNAVNSACKKETSV